MKPDNTQERIDLERRKLLAAAGVGAMAITLGNSIMAENTKTLRWGIVGTGGIANSMAPRIQQADHAELVAVSSRKLATAQEFADSFAIGNAFDSWADMLAFDGVDAIYVATPTSVREEICVAAANAGKHVLGEKPFANLPSLQRITAACRSNGVGFMDGTHFPHHPRTAYIKAMMSEMVGSQWSVASAFQFSLTAPDNIRLNPKLEPYGAIGDTGWYNMRAAVEYLPDDLEPVSVETFMRRNRDNGAAISGSGVIVFDNGATTTWNCGFGSGAGIMDLRISGPAGVIKLYDFLSQRPSDQTGVFDHLTGWGNSELVEVPSQKPGSALMFEDFAAMVGNPTLFEASVRASERTQALLDAAWNSGLQNESKGA